MKHNIGSVGLRLRELDQRRVRLAWAVLSLVLFVMGAGAPAASSGSGG